MLNDNQASDVGWMAHSAIGIGQHDYQSSAAYTPLFNLKSSRRDSSGQTPTERWVPWDQLDADGMSGDESHDDEDFDEHNLYIRSTHTI